MIKDSKYININIENPLYLIINKVNEYFEEINGNKYLMLVPNENKLKIKKYEELCSKIRDLISSADVSNVRISKLRWLVWKIYENQI